MCCTPPSTTPYLEPFENHRGIQTSGVGKNDLLDGARGTSSTRHGSGATHQLSGSNTEANALHDCARKSYRDELDITLYKLHRIRVHIRRWLSPQQSDRLTDLTPL